MCLSLPLSLCLSVSVSLCVSVCLSVSVSISLSLSVHLSVSVYACDFLFVSLFLSLPLCLSLPLSFCLCISLCVSLSVCLSVCVSTSHIHTKRYFLYVYPTTTDAQQVSRLVPSHFVLFFSAGSPRFHLWGLLLGRIGKTLKGETSLSPSSWDMFAHSGAHISAHSSVPGLPEFMSPVNQTITGHYSKRQALSISGSCHFKYLEGSVCSDLYHNFESST
jgi:hypothetical protein